MKANTQKRGRLCSHKRNRMEQGISDYTYIFNYIFPNTKLAQPQMEMEKEE